MFFHSAQEYGELADECSDAYFLYGKALLELHRLESTAFGDAIKNEGNRWIKATRINAPVKLIG